MAYTTSRSWASPEAKEAERYQVTRNAMRRLFPRADVAEWDMAKWLDQRRAMLAGKSQRYITMLNQKEQARRRGDKPLKRFLNGKELKEHRGPVLCQETIWAPKFHPKKDRAPWPTIAEMKWEGEDRAKTNVGRYLPLPREPGNATVVWHHLQVVPQYPLDQIRLIPTLEDILLPVDEIDDDKVPDLINAELLRALDSNALF